MPEPPVPCERVFHVLSDLRKRSCSDAVDEPEEPKAYTEKPVASGSPFESTERQIEKKLLNVVLPIFQAIPKKPSEQLKSLK